MTKELIISANVHEKKVSIIEDGVVTEFYVERRDENQGVVGNLYKGRVMKVLPGMQSAFVDIGLERDAFLYVSDFTEFMEDEEEIDFKEATEDLRAAPPPRDDRSRRPDRQRPPIAASVNQRSQERLIDDKAAESQVLFEDVVEQLAEIADESVIPPPPSEEELDVEAARFAAGGEREVEEADAAVVEELLGDESSEPTEQAVEAEPESEDEGPPRRRGRGRGAAKEKAATRAEKPMDAQTAAPEPGKRRGRAPARRTTRRREIGRAHV